ncbi:hypothetical protein ACFQUU_08565 [Herbaspirillum sp. GCM10030257]|uniref:hypothetical protein n=1 Tax=Herbaspirillum sp. GCM10030257 TaxID=3273393 RepID=UPI00360E8A8B
MMGLSRKGGMNARWIAMRCKEQPFWTFLANTFGTTVRNEEEAVATVYLFGCVDSRAEFDTKPEAANRFHQLFRRPYADFVDRTTTQHA